MVQFLRSNLLRKKLQNALNGNDKSKTQVKREVDKTINVMVSVSNKKK
jgi:hypothetical protein